VFESGERAPKDVVIVVDRRMVGLLCEFTVRA